MTTTGSWVARDACDREDCTMRSYQHRHLADGRPEPAVADCEMSAVVARATTPGDDRGRERRSLVLADREAELLEAKGPCSDPECRLHFAHRGPHDVRALAAPAETEAGDAHPSDVTSSEVLDGLRQENASIVTDLNRALALASRWVHGTPNGQIGPGDQATREACARELMATLHLYGPPPDSLAATPPAPESEAVTTAEIVAWHRARFGGDPADVLVMGKLAEEAGEVCGAITKRAEGAVRPAKGLVTREDWSAHLLDEVGDVGIVLHTLCAREGTTLDEVVTRRFRDDVSLRTDQEAASAPAGPQAEGTGSTADSER